MPEPRKLRVFICHASQDQLVVNELYKRLLTESWIEPWLAEESILPGQNWRAEIDKAVEAADVVIATLSRSSVNLDGYTQREIKYALDIAREKPDSTIYIVPIRLDNCQVPREMRAWHYLDFALPSEREPAYRRLIRSLQAKADLVMKQTNESQAAHFVYSSPSSSDVVDLTASTFGGFKFMKIPNGKFIMGSKVSNNCAWEDEIPQRPYAIPYDYWITRVPIFNEQFGEFAVSTKQLDLLPKGWKKNLDYPIVKVSWHDALNYTKWLNIIFRKEIPPELIFRLPTEAEWERASRGDHGQEWPWGNVDLDELLEQKEADYFGNSRDINSVKIEIKQLRYTLGLTSVGSFSPFTDSPYQIADMMGSILEWTQSLYAAYPYDVQDGRENLVAKGKRVIRGCFIGNSERFSVRSARRGYALPDQREAILGFRIVVASPTSL
jgi:formylglycine-generating enzyme required for sulfatase activity